MVCMTFRSGHHDRRKASGNPANPLGHRRNQAGYARGGTVGDVVTTLLPRLFRIEGPMPTGSLLGSRRARTSTWPVRAAEHGDAAVAEHDGRVVVPVERQTAMRTVVEGVDLLADYRVAA